MPLHFVLDVIRSDPELALLYLNFYGRAADTGERSWVEHWFDPALADCDPADGLHIYQRSIEGPLRRGDLHLVDRSCAPTSPSQGIERVAASASTTGAAWRSGVPSARSEGHVHVTRETYVECTLGQSYWQKDPLAWFRIRHRDIPQVYRR